MRKALIVTLVVLLVVTGVPVLVPGMAIGACHDCGPATVVASCFGVLLAAAVMVLVLLASFLQLGRDEMRVRLCAVALDRPPRLV